MKFKYAIATVVAAGATALALAPGASADTNDAAYLAQLRNQGINYSSESFAIGLGHAICDDLGHGYSVIAEANVVMAGSAKNGWSISPYNAGFLVGTAHMYYCSDLNPAISSPNNTI